MWQEYALIIAGGFISVLIGIIAYGARKRNDNIDSIESKLTNLDKSFAIKVEWFSNFEKKVDTYFTKMDNLIKKMSEIETAYDNISGAANLVKNALGDFQKMANDLKTDALDVMKEIKALSVTNKKRQAILEKQVSKICDKLDMKFEYDPDLFLDYDVFRKFKND